MPRRRLHTVLVIVSFGLAAMAARAEPHEPAASRRPILPGTGPEIAAGIHVDRVAGLPQAPLLEAIGNWLSLEFGLPRADLPRIAIASVTEMIAIRYATVLPGSRAGDAGPETEREIVALYSDEEDAIFLPASWTGTTPAEISVLVHEMVHHLQHRAGLRYDCAEAREKPAFAAQERWLALFGTNLMTEFGIDPMTLLVRTNCSR